MEYDNANTIDLDDIDYGYEPEVTDEPIDEPIDNSDEPTDEPSSDDQNEFDLTRELLTRQGIIDINKIKFQDESGAVVERSWDSLSNDEKIMILSHQEDPETSLDDEEIKLINKIRDLGMTPGQYIQSLQVQEQPITTYSVDELSDDDLFVLDILDKMGEDNITEEEVQELLNNAKANENLYKRQVASLRVYYKDLEQKLEQQKEEERILAEEQRYTQYSEGIKNSIRNFNSFDDAPVELSLEDMEDLANYILTKDVSGRSEFDKLFFHPDQITKAAFWALNGPKLMNEYQNQIKEAYLRGYNETHKQAPKVFKKSEPSKGATNHKDSQYAYFDEESYLNN